jgi:hypothetical protein
MSAPYTTFFQYLVIAAVVVLLAPYAGCHILTTAPHTAVVTEHDTGELNDAALKPRSSVDNQPEDHDTQTGSTELSDINDLLAK